MPQQVESLRPCRSLVFVLGTVLEPTKGLDA